MSRKATTDDTHEDTREKLAGAKTLEEVLNTAMAFEATARDFYTDLAKRVSKPMRALVEELAEEEIAHYEMFAKVRDLEDTHAHLKDRIAVPAVDHKFSEFVHAPDLGENPDDQAVLQYAMAREQAAYEEYAGLAKTTPPGPLHDLFVFLAAEELEHKAELEKAYYELVHSGGV